MAGVLKKASFLTAFIAAIQLDLHTRSSRRQSSAILQRPARSAQSPRRYEDRRAILGEPTSVFCDGIPNLS